MLCHPDVPRSFFHDCHVNVNLEINVPCALCYKFNSSSDFHMLSAEIMETKFLNSNVGQINNSFQHLRNAELSACSRIKGSCLWMLLTDSARVRMTLAE